MLRRLPCLLATAAAVAACTPSVPDSGAGVGFGDYATYQTQREAQLSGAMQAQLPPVNAYGQGVTDPGAPLSAMPGAVPGMTPGASPQTGFSTERLGAAIDAAEAGTPLPPQPQALPGMPPSGAVIGSDVGASLSADRPRGDAPAGIQIQAGEVNPDNIGISDEQDFNAVAARETIESDKARLERNRAQYQVITPDQVVQPTALPERRGDSGPNIVAFALSTTHLPGTPVYKRPALRMANADAACGRYGSSDQAQRAFLAAGGPEKDPRGLDPDGDGFVCGWDPRPFRAN
ncbi:hypothetical protein E7811_16810 [Aliigemmobacter aestuarii]|uniref:Excalibur calcium-binding domain-containing protein n=1 Tax=Aliigemmobacter aestuarii TaxID=1445661 RepID=A0A4S3MKK0_9RHOB|nr:hypothetical protein [Gemmobacter aestuarii]THD81563.1 hypothetical protein E7811_16810 [Gemmobacter aestuarii]